MLFRRTFLMPVVICVIAAMLFLITGCNNPGSNNNIQGNANETTKVFSGGTICMKTSDGIEYAEAVVVQEGKFAFVGALNDALEFASSDCEQIDLEGKLMTPSFFESHAHPNWSTPLDFRNFVYAGPMPTPEEYVEYIRKFVQEHPDSSAIRGIGWDFAVFGGEYPTKDILDEVSTEIPIFLRDTSLHIAWANSRALELAGLTKDIPDPEGGRVVRDEKGEPSGVVLDLASVVVEDALPPLTKEDHKELILQFQEMEYSFGVTGHMTALVAPDSEQYAAYRELLDEGKLKMYTQLAFQATPETYKECFEWLKTERTAYEKDPNPLLKLGLIKFFVDGVISNQSAYLLEAYATSPDWRGEPMWPTETLEDAFKICTENDFRIHVHATGDAGTRMTLDALEKATVPNRHSITHIELTAPEDIARFGELEIIAMINPYWFGRGESFDEIEAIELGPERTERMYLAKSFYETGARVSAASDYPVCPVPDPIGGLYMAVNRTIPENWREGRSAEECTLNKSEAITIEQAFDAFTLSAAYSFELDDVTGSIEVGKTADFVIWNENLFEEITDNTKPLETWFMGELVYKAK